MFDETVPVAPAVPEKIIKDKYSELVAKKKRTDSRLEQMRKAKREKEERDLLSYQNARLYQRGNRQKEQEITDRFKRYELDAKRR